MTNKAFDKTHVIEWLKNKKQKIAIDELNFRKNPPKEGILGLVAPTVFYVENNLLDELIKELDES